LTAAARLAAVPQPEQLGQLAEMLKDARRGMVREVVRAVAEKQRRRRAPSRKWITTVRDRLLSEAARHGSSVHRLAASVLTWGP